MRADNEISISRGLVTRDQLIEKIKRIKKLQGAQAWLPYEISLN